MNNLKDWLPISVYQRENRTFVDWCFMGNARFTEPFFDITIQRRLQIPFNILFRHQTPFELLGELHEKNSQITPNGFIFHLSRCGSTLVSQMLAALPQNIVISEAPPIDEVLRLNAASEEEKIVWLKWIIGALGQKRNDAEKHYFIKFDCWHTSDLALIKRAFPEVPWIFLYRNPLEIIVSQMRQRGLHTIPDRVANLPENISLQKALEMLPEEFCARRLKSICESALQFAETKNAKLVNYTQLFDALDPIILKHFRVEYSAEDLEKMRFVTQFNSKVPQMFFTPDTETKRLEATDAALRAAELVNPLYKKLEQIRLSK